ncbi:hypothetical protein NQ317_004493 [Molorchus minor]|uniref:Uncharacterized protein n=1 Tax=Molorchus minor TaxID=1323400 RepID=A0ABQ9IXC5_9CUCU|nr:hypothetical protein NQ317_004493 [Molorchus minor]
MKTENRQDKIDKNIKGICVLPTKICAPERRRWKSLFKKKRFPAASFRGIHLRMESLHICTAHLREASLLVVLVYYVLSNVLVSPVTERNLYKKGYNKQHDANVVPCTNNNPPPPGQVCDVQLSKNWHPCLEESGFGFDDDFSGPCIFLKLNKVRYLYRSFVIMVLVKKFVFVILACSLAHPLAPKYTTIIKLLCRLCSQDKLSARVTMLVHSLEKIVISHLEYAIKSIFLNGACKSVNFSQWPKLNFLYKFQPKE